MRAIKFASRLLWAVALVALPGLGREAQAQSCDANHLINWPDINPVWTICWVAAPNSSGIDGSGLELTWAAYQGKQVLFNASMPVINVKYDPGGCGGADLSFRDWGNQEERFQANNVIRPGYAEPTAPPVTVCENPGTDIGSFYGVAAEKLSDRLILTTQITAGWYRYIPQWTFHLDGRIEPVFRFTAVNNTCTPLPHYHNMYWRLDFDVEGPADDVIEENNAGTWTTLNTEIQRPRDPASSRRWRVRDSATGTAWEIWPGVGDDTADAWSVADMWALKYGNGQQDDGGATGGLLGDQVHVSNFVNGEAINGQDIVLWYRGGFRHEGPADCEISGPTLAPAGVHLLSASDASVMEGEEGTTQATFTATLSASSTNTVTVDWETHDGVDQGSGADATSPDDFVAASGTLEFLPGITTRTFSVTVNGDTTFEPNEQFHVALSGATNAIIVDGEGIGTILDDDTSAAPPNQDAEYDLTLQVPACLTVGVGCDSGPVLLDGRDGGGPEPNEPNTINDSCADGTSGTYHSDESNDRIVVSTLDSTTLTPGKTVRVDATVWAWTSPSVDTLELYYAADATNPTWVPFASLTPTVGGPQTLSANYTLPVGTLQAVRARFRFQGTAGACLTGDYDDHDDLVFAVQSIAADEVPPVTAITAPAESATVGGVFNVTASASDNVGVARVEFYIDGLLRSTDTTAPYSYAWDTTMESNASHTIYSKAYDLPDNVATSTTVNVTVSNQIAVFDATLGVPKCATVAASCDSGPSLLNSRDGVGPGEPNQPNTINNSCADGTGGVYHVDESNDRLRIVTVDGSPLEAGKTVRVEATVWAYSANKMDSLDLYYAADANSPTWTLISTQNAHVEGAETLSAVYTLPPGALQAVRARFRYLGSASSCATGNYDDYDDLVFAVQ